MSKPIDQIESRSPGPLQSRLPVSTLFPLRHANHIIIKIWDIAIGIVSTEAYLCKQYNILYEKKSILTAKKGAANESYFDSTSDLFFSFSYLYQNDNSFDTDMKKKIQITWNQNMI